MEPTTFVGIEVSKDPLDVLVLPSEEVRATPRDAKGLAELCHRLKEAGVIAVDATCGFGMIVAECNRRRQLTANRPLKSIDRVVTILKAHLAEIDRDLDASIQGMPAHQPSSLVKREVLKGFPPALASLRVEVTLPEFASLQVKVNRGP